MHLLTSGEIIKADKNMLQFLDVKTIATFGTTPADSSLVGSRMQGNPYREK